MATGTKNPQGTATTGRAGAVAILGRPNVGKSTLLNRIVGQKLAVVSAKPQTTRDRITGVWNGEGGQIVFVDTPGVHAAGRNALNRYMVGEAMTALETLDAVLLVVEAPREAQAAGLPAAARRLGESERRILDACAEARKPVVLAINKVDQVKDKAALLPLLTAWAERFGFGALVPVSAARGTGVPDLVREVLKVVPEGPPLYSPDQLTDRTERFLAGELIREQLFGRLRQELPYSTAVIIDNWEERPAQGDAVIDATIIVERESQRGIVVGKAGAMIRDIGIAARKEIADLIGRPAHVRLHVKVMTDWTESTEDVARLGYRKDT